MPIHRFPKQSSTRQNLFARILQDDGPSHVGIVLERVQMEPEVRVLVEFGRPEAPLFAIGQTIVLNYAGDSDSEDIETRARVVFRGEDERVRRYEFLIDATGFEAPDDRRQHERRRAEAEVRASLRPSGHVSSVPVLVHDASHNGIALQVELWVDKTMVSADGVEIAIDLEDGQPPVVIEGHVVYRRLFAGGVHYGIEFKNSAARGIEQIGRLDRFLGSDALRQAS